jgi:Thaumatin family
MSCILPPKRGDGRRQLLLKNYLPFVIHVGLLGDPINEVDIMDDSWDWSIAPGKCKLLLLPDKFTAGRLWARAKCEKDPDGYLRCKTGQCNTSPSSNQCVSSGASPTTLVEWTLGAGTAANTDYYDISAVDGYSVPITVETFNGTPVNVAALGQCNTISIPEMNLDSMPPELLVYSDQLCDTPSCSIDGKDLESSPCYLTPKDESCKNARVGVLSICKALSTGWIAHYIKQMPIGRYSGTWRDQFTSGAKNCDANGDTTCGSNLAVGTLRKYPGHSMLDLVCADNTFGCSPYQENAKMNRTSEHCPTVQATACETSSNKADACACFSASGATPTGFERLAPTMVLDQPEFPQCDQAKRVSSQIPDWPSSTIQGLSYGTIFDAGKKTPVNKYYVWQFNDSDSTIQCTKGDYVVSFGVHVPTTGPSPKLSATAIAGICIGAATIVGILVLIVYFSFSRVNQAAPLLPARSPVNPHSQASVSPTSSRR